MGKGTRPEPDYEILFLCQDGKTPLLARRKRAKRPAIIRVDIWAKKTWTYWQEKKISFHDSSEAREWASKHGFDGIKIICENWNQS